MRVFMYVLFVKNEGEGEGGRALNREGGLFERGGLNRGFMAYIIRFMFTSSLPFISHFL